MASFHGILDAPKPEDAKNIKGKVLVLHGAADPYMKPEQVNEFIKEMNDAEVDWKMISYGGAVHSFTMPKAGDDKSKGSAYDKEADKDSWAELVKFFSKIF